MGYGLQLLHVPSVVRLSGGEEVFTAAYMENSMAYVGFTDLYAVMVVIT